MKFSSAIWENNKFVILEVCLPLCTPTQQFDCACQLDALFGFSFFLFFIQNWHSQTGVWPHSFVFLCPTATRNCALHPPSTCVTWALNAINFICELTVARTGASKKLRWPQNVRCQLWPPVSTTVIFMPLVWLNGCKKDAMGNQHKERVAVLQGHIQLDMVLKNPENLRTAEIVP